MSALNLGPISTDPRARFSDYLLGVFDGQLKLHPLAEDPDSDFEIILEEPVADETLVSVVEQFFQGGGLVVERKDGTRLPTLVARVPAPDLGSEASYVEVTLTNELHQRPPSFKVRALLCEGKIV